MVKKGKEGNSPMVVRKNDVEEISRADLEAIERHLRSTDGVEVKDRKWMLKTYAACFVGKEMVSWLVEKDYADSRATAVALGHALLMAGVFTHVTRDHDFKDEALFYRFVTHDEGEPSWQDLTTDVGGSRASSAGDLSLLPLLKELDQDMHSRLRDVDLSPMDEHNTRLLEHVHPASWVNAVPEGTYNMVVIGGGTAGLVTAVGSAGLGARVALVERDMLGGDCLNVGCVPSKALIRAARAVRAVREAGDFGVKVGKVKVDFEAVMERVRRVRADVAPHDSIRRLRDKYGIDVYLGTARFVKKGVVEVDGTELKFAKCCIASGASAAIPSLPGLDDVAYLDNSNVFNLTKLPETMAVIGSGAIGCELAQSFAVLGSRVHMFLRGDRVMSREDPEASAIVQAQMEKDGVVIHKNCELQRVHKDNKKPHEVASLVWKEGGDDEAEMAFEHILVATGRKPNVEGMNLEAVGVQYSPTKGVKVSDSLQTTASDVYAAGDVCSQFRFTHAADALARIVIRNALFPGNSKASALSIPWCTFTTPEVAHVGLYEEDLVRANRKFATYRRDLADVDRSICDGETNGFVKVYTREGKDKIVGATVVAPHAGDMIGELNVLATQGIGLSTLAAIIHPYPTVGESIRQLGDEYNRTKLTPNVKILFRKYFNARR